MFLRLTQDNIRLPFCINSSATARRDVRSNSSPVSWLSLHENTYFRALSRGMNRQNILLFGELLMRLSPRQKEFFDSDRLIHLFPGGSEANVATSLGQWNIPSTYVSCVPDNALTKQLLQHISDKNVKTDQCLIKDGRLGLYYLLSANGLTNGDVIYDRSHSSFSKLRPGEINWDALFEGYTW